MRALSATILACWLLAPSLAAQDERPAQPRTQRRSPDRITIEEIQALPDAKDAYDLVRLLRPAFLVERATGSGGRARVGRLIVWVNGAERGPVETLRTIPASAVLEIRKLSATDAVTQYGKDQNGVILVTVSTLIPKDTTGRVM